MRPRQFENQASEIKLTIEPREFYLHEQNLSKLGPRSGNWAVAGLCPFHCDNNPGSFKINVETGAYRCWSCGASGGDIIDFLKNRDDVGFIEALEILICEWGV